MADRIKTRAVSRLRSFDKQTLGLLQDWLNDAAHDAREDDPSVGIYANDDLAEALDLLQIIIEEQTGVGKPND